jgi:hypothetical protein
MATSKGWGLELMDKVQNEGIVHQEVVERIESLMSRNVVGYFTFFAHPAGVIMDEDSTLLENILRSVDLNRYDGRLDLILHSPGGSPIGAEKLLLTCRSYCKEFRVIVPKSAMSAATLVSMGADAIVMGETAEIGPIDPQMVIEAGSQQVARPAAAFVEAYRELINQTQEAIRSQQPPHPYIELLRKLDPVFVQICLKARKLSETLASEYLARYQLKGRTATEIEAVVKKFLEEGEQGTHGRPIRAEKAKEYGLNVEVPDKEGELWKAIWELYMRCEHYVRTRQLAKYFVTSRGGINVQVQAIRL